MRMLLKATIPVEAGNAAASNGTLGTTIQKILAELKPEAAYFTEDGGRTYRLDLLRHEEFLGTHRLSPNLGFWLSTPRSRVRPAMNPQDLAEGLPGMRAAVKTYGKAAGA